MATSLQQTFTYFGPSTATLGLHEWKKSVINALDRFRRHATGIHQHHKKTFHTVTLDRRDQLDFAFAEAINMRIYARRHQNTIIGITVPHDERSFTLSFERKEQTITIKFQLSEHK